MHRQINIENEGRNRKEKRRKLKTAKWKGQEYDKKMKKKEIDINGRTVKTNGKQQGGRLIYKQDRQAGRQTNINRHKHIGQAEDRRPLPVLGELCTELLC